MVQMIGANVLPLEALAPIGKAIQEEVTWIGLSAATSDEKDENPLVCMVCEAIENLLGLCFVICQVFITNVVSVCGRIPIANEQKTKKTKFRSNLLGRCSPIAIKYTQVAMIDGLANYFKHRDEWPSGVLPSDGPAKETACIIKALHGESDSARKLRKGFEAVVGDSEYSRVDRLAESVQSWAEKLRDQYESQATRA